MITSPHKLMIEFEQETDGRWIAEIPVLPGVMAYGSTRSEAAQAVKALALSIVAGILGSIKSERKARSSRLNGKLGGRPLGSKDSKPRRQRNSPLTTLATK